MDISAYSQTAMRKWLDRHNEWWVFFDSYGEAMVLTADPRGPILYVWHDRSGAETWRRNYIAAVGTTFMSAWEPRPLDRRTVGHIFQSERCRILALGHVDTGPGAMLQDFSGRGILDDEPVSPSHSGPAGHMTVQGGEGCVSGSTLVATSYGALPIRTIERGARVLAWAPSLGRLCETEVVRVLVHPEKAVFLIKFADSPFPIRVTPNHAVATRHGWTQAENLQVGDEVLKRRGGRLVRVQVQGVEAGTTPETVYNLHLRRHHTWLADGLVSHSFSWFPQARSLLADLSVGHFESGLLHVGQRAWSLGRALGMS